MSKFERTQKRIAKLYWCGVTVAVTFMATMPAAYASNIWTELSSMLNKIYLEILGISTIVAVVAAAVALVIRLVSKNQRAVDEATSWLKRIVVTWVILNSLGFIVAYLQPLVQGGSVIP